MYRIQDDSNYEIEINKSRFICYLRRVDTEDAAKDFIKEIKKMHPKATHHCQAFLISEDLQRSNDDGEPSGTAGLPMLEVLRKRDMELICAVVVRYFGGVLLGAGGLIRAYSRSVSEALDQTTLYQVTPTKKYSLTFAYSYLNSIEYLLKEATIISKEYSELVTYVYLSNNEQLITDFQEITSGQHLPQYLETIMVEQPLKNHND